MGAKNDIFGTHYFSPSSLEELGIILNNFRYFFIYKFEETLVFFSKWIRRIRVNVDLANIFAIFEQGYHNFSFYVNAAGDIIVLCTHIGHHKVLV